MFPGRQSVPCSEPEVRWGGGQDRQWDTSPLTPTLLGQPPPKMVLCGESVMVPTRHFGFFCPNKSVKEKASVPFYLCLLQRGACWNMYRFVSNQGDAGKLATFFFFCPLCYWMRLQNETQGQAVKSACSMPGPPSGDIFSSRGGHRSSLLVPFFHCVLYSSRESGTNLSGTLLGTFTRRFSHAFYSYLALKEKASAHLPVSSGTMRELCTSST